MSQENVEIVRSGIEHFNRTGKPLLELLSPDIEWWERADDPGGTVHRGPHSVSKWLGELTQVMELHVEAEEFIDAGDYVIASLRLWGNGRASGAQFEEREVHVYRLRDGKQVEVREYRTKAEALEAAGLPD